jgi:predicted outer membrane protein
MRAALISATLLVPVLALADDSAKKVDAASYTPSQFIGKLAHKNTMKSDIASLAKTNASSAKVKAFGAKIVKDYQKLDRAVNDYAKANDISLSTARMEFEQLMEESFTPDEAAATPPIPEAGTEAGRPAGTVASGQSATPPTGETGAEAGRSAGTVASGQSAEAAESWKASSKEKLEQLRAMSGADFDREFLTRISEGADNMIMFLDEYKAEQADKKLNSLINQYVSTLKNHQREAKRLLGDVPAA